jgi:hypothetical protein
VKVKQRELNYSGEGYDATDFGKAGHDRFRVFLIGVDQVCGKDEVRL